MLLVQVGRPRLPRGQQGHPAQPTAQHDDLRLIITVDASGRQTIPRRHVAVGAVLLSGHVPESHPR